MHSYRDHVPAELLDQSMRADRQFEFDRRTGAD
jgi:hypothetical protein